MPNVRRDGPVWAAVQVSAASVLPELRPLPAQHCGENAGSRWLVSEDGGQQIHVGDWLLSRNTPRGTVFKVLTDDEYTRNWVLA